MRSNTEIVNCSCGVQNAAVMAWKNGLNVGLMQENVPRGSYRDVSSLHDMEAAVCWPACAA